MVDLPPSYILPYDSHQIFILVFLVVSPPLPVCVCVCVSSLYKAKFPHQQSQISHAHPCMLWSLPQKSVSSLYTFANEHNYVKKTN